MITIKEVGAIALSILVLAISFTLFHNISIFPMVLLAVFLVLVINVFAKKIMAFLLETETEMRIWEVERFGFKPGDHFKRALALGVFLPLISALITIGNIVWMTPLVYEVKPKVTRSAKRHGIYSYSHISEDHIGYIAAAGVVANLIFAIIGYLTGFTFFAKLNIYLAFFSMIPLSDLDGNKIFFGNLTLWTILSAVTLLGLGYTFFLV